MSLAQKLPIYDRTLEGTAVRKLPQEGTVVRPKAKPKRAKRSHRGVALLVFGWVAAMAVAMVVIYQNTLVQRQSAAAMQAKEELATVRQLNQELETRLVQADSVAAVEKWATEHKMVRPNNVKTLAGDPQAVAPKAEPAAVGAKPADGKGLLAAAKAFFARFTGTAQATAGN